MPDVSVRHIPKVGFSSLARPQILPLLAFVAVIMVVSLFFVWSRIQVVNLDYDISRMEGQVRDLKQEAQQLRLEAASLRSPGRIEKVAVRKLGLRQPTPDQVLLVD